MKKLIITLEYPPQVGGVASYVYNLGAHLPASEVVLYAPRTAGDKEFDDQHPWKVYRRRPYWLVWPHWLRMFFQVWSIIRRERIEEIYIHHVLPAGYIGYLFKKFRKIPYTIFLHGTDVTMATSTAWKRKNFQRICNGASQVVVNSNFLKSKLAQKIEMKAPVVTLYPAPADIFLDGVDAKRVAGLRHQLALDGKKVILSVGRMVEGKGWPHLMRLLPSLVQRAPNLVWLLVGDGPKRALLVEMAQKNNLENCVRFVGAVAYDQLPFYYRLADLFVLLTHADEDAAEGWGTAFVEAAASGLPVVAGRSGGAEEAVEHLVTGLVVDAHQERAVLKDIAELLKNEAYAKKMGATGRARVMQELTWEKQIVKL